MPKEYCPTCGAATDYLTSAPKFCSSCGKPFDFSSAVHAVAAIAGPARNKRKATARDYEEDEEDEDEELETSAGVKIPKKLDISFKADPDPRVSLAEIVVDAPSDGGFGRVTKKKSHRRALTGVLSRTAPAVRGEGIEVGE